MSDKHSSAGSLSAQNYHLLRGMYYSIFTILCAVLLFAMREKVDATGWVFGGMLTALFAALTTYSFIKIKKSNPQAVVYVVPTAGPPAFQLQWYRRMFWMSLVAFPVLAAITAWDLYEVETGAEQRVSVVAPIGIIYEYLGFIPAVIIIPLVGVLCLTVFFFKIRALRRNASSK